MNILISACLLGIESIRYNKEYDKLIYRYE